MMGRLIRSAAWRLKTVGLTDNCEQKIDVSFRYRRACDQPHAKTGGGPQPRFTSGSQAAPATCHSQKLTVEADGPGSLRCWAGFTLGPPSQCAWLQVVPLSIADWITRNVYSHPSNEPSLSTTPKNPPRPWVYIIQPGRRCVCRLRLWSRDLSILFGFHPFPTSKKFTISTMSQDTGLWSVRRPREVSTSRRLVEPFCYPPARARLCPLQQHCHRHAFPDCTPHTTLTLMSSRRLSEASAIIAQSHSQRPQ